MRCIRADLRRQQLKLKRQLRAPCEGPGAQLAAEAGVLTFEKQGFGVIAGKGVDAKESVVSPVFLRWGGYRAVGVGAFRRAARAGGSVYLPLQAEASVHSRRGARGGRPACGEA